jgi:glycosyltransferase involved in cell wall biosynthesis
MMRILFVTYSPAPYRMTFFNELGRSCELTVLCEKEPAEIRNRYPAWFEGSAERFRMYFMQDARKVFRQTYDLAVVCGYSTAAEIMSLFILKQKRIPMLISADGCLKDVREPLWKYLLKRYLISMADGYLVSSEETKHYLMRYVQDKPFWIYPFTTLTEKDLQMLDHFDRSALRERFHMHGLCIFAAGQMIPRKGFDLLKEAVSGLPDMHLYLAGGTEVRDEGRIHECGFLTHHEILEYLCACDIFVHPARQEVWGLCAAEALGAGKAVIITDTCTAGRELIRDHENGILIHADQTELCEALKELRDPDLRQYLAHQARIHMRNYTIEQMAEAHRKAFEDVLQIQITEK